MRSTLCCAVSFAAKAAFSVVVRCARVQASGGTALQLACAAKKSDVADFLAQMSTTEELNAVDNVRRSCLATLSSSPLV